MILYIYIQITELNLDNCKSTHVTGLTDEYVNLRVLSLQDVGLKSLAGFPHLKNLRMVSTIYIFANFHSLLKIFTIF